jgi:hypothetical protein
MNKDYMIETVANWHDICLRNDFLAKHYVSNIASFYNDLNKYGSNNEEDVDVGMGRMPMTEIKKWYDFVRSTGIYIV